MADQSASLRDWTTIGLGALAAVIGLYYFLVGFGLAPAAPAPKGEANAPTNCIGLLVGLVFSAGGLAVTLRGAIGADRQSSELPAGAPKWVAAVYWRLGLLVASGLAATAPGSHSAAAHGHSI